MSYFQKNMLRPKDWTRSPLTFVHVMQVSHNLSWREADSIVLGDACGGYTSNSPKRYHVSGFTSWCSLFFTARRSEKYDTLPMTSTAGVNWLPPADLVPDLIWCILRHNFEKCYSGIYFIFHSWSRSDRYNTPCSLSYSVLRQEYLPHVHWPRRVWMIFPI